MRAPLFLASILSLLFFLCGSLQAQRGGQAATKENLDLPYDAFGLTEEEEEAPEVVFFYGQQYEGDGFFFTLDRSSSTAQGELEIEKRESIRTISQFSKKVQFAVVFYDQGVLAWPPSGRPAEANGAMKSAAISFLSTIQSGRGTCVREGLIRSLSYANRSTAKRNVIIYLGDGGTHCPGHNAQQYGQATLSGVASANFKRHPINVICVGTDQVFENWCRQLAAQSGGSYKRITR